MSLLQQLEAESPGFAALLESLSRYFSLPRLRLDPKLEKALSEKTFAHWQECCVALKEARVFDKLEVTSDAQVGAMWTNELFNCILNRGFDFTPPADICLRDYLSPPLKEEAAIQERVSEMVQAHPESYWQRVFGLVFPEFFLEPYLRPAERILQGVDLACGWGRATFNLGHWERKKVYAVDLSESGLQWLRSQSEHFGLADKIVVQRQDISELSFADDSMDFILAFDIFEHLTDPTLDRALQEILRVARSGAVLYCEVPLNDYFPPITHLQNFSFFGFLDRMQKTSFGKKTFQLSHVNQFFPGQFSFCIVHPMFARRVEIPEEESLYTAVH